MPYEDIVNEIWKWCEDNVFAPMLVTISIGYEWEKPYEETHYLDFDANEFCFIWDSDWYEGQQYVSLVGFTPVYWVRVVGAAGKVMFK